MSAGDLAIRFSLQPVVAFEQSQLKTKDRRKAWRTGVIGACGSAMLRARFLFNTRGLLFRPRRSSAQQGKS